MGGFCLIIVILLSAYLFTIAFSVSQVKGHVKSRSYLSSFKSEVAVCFAWERGVFGYIDSNAQWLAAQTYNLTVMGSVQFLTMTCWSYLYKSIYPNFPLSTKLKMGKWLQEVFSKEEFQSLVLKRQLFCNLLKSLLVRFRMYLVGPLGDLLMLSRSLATAEFWLRFCL